MAVVDKTKQYRPSTENLECQNYVIEIMKLCWSENPQIRPSKNIF